MKKAFVVIAAALSMSGAFAQTAAAPAQPASPAMGAPAAQHRQHVEERIAFLHSTLKITPAQEPQWKTFADQMRSNSETMAELFMRRTQSDATRNALDDMKQYAQIAQTHADDMQKLVTAFEPLYNSLSPEQKTIADQTFRHHGPQGGMRGPRSQNRRGMQGKPASAPAQASAPAVQ